MKKGASLKKAKLIEFPKGEGAGKERENVYFVLCPECKRAIGVVNIESGEMIITGEHRDECERNVSEQLDKDI